MSCVMWARRDRRGRKEGAQRGAEVLWVVELLIPSHCLMLLITFLLAVHTNTIVVHSLVGKLSLVFVIYLTKPNANKLKSLPNFGRLFLWQFFGIR